MFSDITEKYSYDDKRAIEFVNAIGVMAGMEDGAKFCPGKEVTNSEVCMIFSLLLEGIPKASTDTTNKFYDRHWAKIYIGWVDDRLSKRGKDLWFDKESIDQSITQEQFNKQFSILFETLIKNPNATALSHKEEEPQINMSRLMVANKVYSCCKEFFEQTKEYKVTELLDFWAETEIANPYRLLVNIYSTGMFDAPKWKDNEGRSPFYKLSLLKDVPPKNGPQIYEKFGTIDGIEAQCEDIFTNHKGSAFHYTTLSALCSMLKESNNAPIGESPRIRLFMSNAEYLNDPGEGKYLDTTRSDSSMRDRTIISPQDTYIISLTLEEKEQLPMWVQYGGDGAGCRIEFDITSRDNFRRVRYLDSGDQADTKVEQIIQDLLDYKDSEEIVFEYAKNVIDKIKYQVKSAYYSHENEVRHSTMQIPQLAKEFSFLRPGEVFPRLYCELENPLRIKSVMLGPKCQNVNATALFLYRCGVPEVKVSSIEFR